MQKDMQFKSFVLFSSPGCLLPFLLVFNLFFGWIFFKPLQWLLVEGILILFFILNSWVVTKKIFSRSSRHKDKGAIDVEGKVITEDFEN